MKHERLFTSAACLRAALRIGACTLLVGGAQASVDPAAAGAVEVEAFHPASIRGGQRISYPFVELLDGVEGWVELNMMIDPNGKPYAVTVLDSTGIWAFEQAAIKQVEKLAFTPAVRAGTPIHSSLTFKVKFYMRQPEPSARPDFLRTYAKLMRAIDKGDKARADDALADLKVRNLYEDAYRHLGTYQHNRKWGTELQQLAALRGAVAGEPSPQYLPKKLFVGVLSALLTLETRLQDYGSALQTWKRLKPLAPPELRAAWQSTMDEVVRLRDDDRMVRLAAQISRGSSWHTQLFKKRFQIIVAGGKISEIRLRCEQQYLAFAHDPGLQYQVDARNGECGIELVGDPGTRFELVQS